MDKIIVTVTKFGGFLFTTGVVSANELVDSDLKIGLAMDMIQRGISAGDIVDPGQYVVDTNNWYWEKHEQGATNQ